uniref:SMP-LTD domain-containing protein n=1 Tax=Triticum urartu TaxID=4572 RepID=A0A8R7UPW0_TRIUA
MAVAIFLSGFLLGLLALALAEGAALLWAVRALRRRGPRPPPPPEAAAAELSGDRPFPAEKQGFLWMLEPGKVPKVRNGNRLPPTGVQKGVKDKKNIVEVSPIRMRAKIQGHSLVLTGSDGSQITIGLLDCTVLAVSASNLPSRKWSKRYPIKLESKGSEICKRSKVCYLYVDTSWEKESWCKALRLASSTDKEKLKLHTRLSEEFRSYISSLHAGYPCFLKSTALSAEDREIMDKAVKSDGSSKMRLFLKKLARKASIKAPQLTRTSSTSAQAERKTLQKTRSYNGAALIDAQEERFSDSPETNVDEKFTDEGTLCWNLLISRLFFDAKMSDDISKSIKTRLQRKLSNMRTASYIGEITLTDFSLGELPPYLRRMRVVPRDLNELWAFEFDFEYCSEIILNAEARLEVQEPELKKDIMRATPEADTNGNQFEPSQLLASVVEDEDEAGLFEFSIYFLSIAYYEVLRHVICSLFLQKVPFSLAIKVTSIRGTMRMHIKPPPSDQIWYGFTSMPELVWELESSVGDRKITNSHIASLISNRIKASLHQSLVLPNCESIPMSWMISEKDDWVPRRAAPFIWLNREHGEAASNHSSDMGKLQPDDVAALKVSSNSEASKSSPPAPSTRSDDEALKKVTSTRWPNQESTTEASTSSGSSVPSEAEPSNQLMAPLLSTREFEEDASENPAAGSSLQLVAVVPAGHRRPPLSSSASPGEYDLKRKGSKRAAVIGLGRKMSGKLEEKTRHIVEKIKESSGKEQ